MKISVIGCGYLGAVHAVCMARLGHEVVAIDIDEDRIAQLAAGEPPFHEPGFPELLREAHESGRITFTTDFSQAASSRVHFLCVGTPQLADGYAADVSQVDGATASLIPHLAPNPDGPTIVVGKSTVPVGTAQRLQEWMDAEAAPEARATLVWNPEFLREGFGVEDTLSPDRIVYGFNEGANSKAAVAALDEVYAEALSRDIPRLLTDFATSELVKVAANSFLATKISFINAMAELCDAAGADVTKLAEAIGLDERIGPKFLRAGLGFGGGCLPKDIRAFMARAGELGADQALTFLREVDAINSRRRDSVVQILAQRFDGQLSGRRIAILGAAFKPGTDDVRDSPALDVATRLAGQGARVVVTDPIASDNASIVHPELTVKEDFNEALQGAEAVALLTEWPEYKELDPFQVAELVDVPYIFDGRNVLNPQRWRDAGWTFRGFGRP